MTQTLAIFYDAYRSLNAKKMFWIVLILSVIVAGAFGCVGFNEGGVKILVWQLDNHLVNSAEIEPAVFYKWIFAQFGIGVWLAWLATILALISTAGIFPDLINSGSIHLLVSKPIGRLRLFLTQYAAGLLFVTLQVTLFTLVCFLVIGLRGGAWEPGLFVAVPLVVCFFSYLFCVCVLLGLVTRSTLAALLLTILFWFLFPFGVGQAEIGLLNYLDHQKHGYGPPVAAQVYPPESRKPPRQLAGNPPGASSPAREANAATNDTPARKPAGKVPRAIGRSLLKALAEPSAEDDKKDTKDTNEATPWAKTSKPASNKPRRTSPGGPEADDGKSGSDNWKLAHNILYAAKTILPKTGETIGLLQRNLYEMADLPPGALGRPYENQRAMQETQETILGRSVWWVVGTSLGFEAVVLCLAAFIFCRRDY